MSKNNKCAGVRARPGSAAHLGALPYSRNRTNKIEQTKQETHRFGRLDLFGRWTVLEQGGGSSNNVGKVGWCIFVVVFTAILLLIGIFAGLLKATTSAVLPSHELNDRILVLHQGELVELQAGLAAREISLR